MTEDHGKIGHNAKARAEIIRQTMVELDDLEAQRKSIGEDIRKLKATKIKGDLGMKIGDFNIAYRLYQLESKDRDRLLDSVRECFDALEIGHQVDWVKEFVKGDDAKSAAA